MQAQHWDTSMDNRPIFEAPFHEPFYSSAKQLLRSTHSSSRRRQALERFVADPDRRSGRRLLGALFHSVKRPLMMQRTRRLAQPNAQAVPMTW